MKIAVKNPAPVGLHHAKWGDYHFGKSLQLALEARGAVVSQSYWPDWGQNDDADVLLVLHGKRKYIPPRDRRSFLWVLSHPSTLTADELNAYSVVFAASETHRTLLKGMTETPVELMRQCTDVHRFAYSERTLEEQASVRKGILFAANSRGTRRDMVLWAVENGVSLELIGRHWEQVGLAEYVKREYVDNHELPAVYQSSRIGLNDHWADMRHFGIISNRIFDYLACGLPVISDGFPELREVFGNGLLYANTSSEFSAAIKLTQERYLERLEETRRTWERLRARHTFDASADQIIAQVAAAPSRHCNASFFQVRVQDLARVEASVRDNAAHVLQRGRDLESRLSAVEKTAAELSGALDKERASAELIRKDADALLKYAEVLEARYFQVLRSTSWRVLAPFRLLARWVRYVATGRKPGKSSLPEKPPLRSRR